MSDGPAVLADWIASRAAILPDHIALVAEGKSWTFGDLDAEIARLVRRLTGLGVKSGDRIATLLHNGAVAAMLPHAALRLGAALVPLNTRLTNSEIAWQIADSAPRLVLAQASTLGSLDGEGIRVVSIDSEGERSLNNASLHDCDEANIDVKLEHAAHDVLAIIYTSGTTGQSKGAMLTVGNFWWSAIGSALNLETKANDRWLACLPLFHVGGLSILIRSAIYGTTAVVHDGFDATVVNDAIDNDGITIVSVVSVMLQRMLDARGDRPYPSSLRCVLLGGGSTPLSLLERCAPLGIPVVQTYGLTEAATQVATLSPDEAIERPGSAGRPLSPNEVRIVLTDGTDAEADEPGEILVRGPIVMAGYSGQPEATARAITNGWLRTGDIGSIDTEGYLYVLDRRDDLIVTGGENVYPAEVEAALLSHPTVEECAVIGVADSEWGQRVVAIIHPIGPGSADTSALKDYLRERVAGYKVPREFRFVSESLPRTASGKIRRAALRGDEPKR